MMITIMSNTMIDTIPPTIGPIGSSCGPGGDGGVPVFTESAMPVETIIK